MNWIRCKDRLPEKEGRYLVTEFAGEFRDVYTALWIPKSGKWIPDRSGMWGRGVVAWMPLPEPYKMDEVTE